MANYLRRKLLGKGAMGEVYASEDPAGKPVAVKNVRKTITTNPDMVARLGDEARLLERVVHHNVVRAVDRGTDADGVPYLVMSYAEGITLRDLIERDGLLPVPRVFAIAAQILTGLAAIHEARVVHADIKSSNILIDDQDRVTIIDFGLARTLSRELPRESALVGTPAFMAPEVVTGSPPTVVADIYAVGVIMYEMLTGITPFAHAADVFAAHLHEPVVAPSLRAPNQRISCDIDDLVLRALDKNPERRFANARDFAAALDKTHHITGRTDTLELALARAQSTRDLGIRPTHRFDRDVAQPISVGRAPTTSSRVRDIISTTLDTAGELINSHDLYGAIAEIERGLSALLEVENSATLDAEAWRLESVLAAVYDNLGRRAHARCMATLAHSHARKSGNAIGIERTQALVERLAVRARATPLASGSVDTRRAQRLPMRVAKLPAKRR